MIMYNIDNKKVTCTRSIESLYRLYDNLVLTTKFWKLN